MPPPLLGLALIGLLAVSCQPDELQPAGMLRVSTEPLHTQGKAVLDGSDGQQTQESWSEHDTWDNSGSNFF